MQAYDTFEHAARVGALKVIPEQAAWMTRRGERRHQPYQQADQVVIAALDTEPDGGLGRDEGRRWPTKRRQRTDGRGQNGAAKCCRVPERPRCSFSWRRRSRPAVAVRGRYGAAVRSPRHRCRRPAQRRHRIHPGKRGIGGGRTATDGGGTRARDPRGEPHRSGEPRSSPETSGHRGGDTVAADARVIQSTGLQVAEPTLTGESVPVSKGPRPLSVTSPLATRPT